MKSVCFFLLFLGIILLYAVGVYVYMSKQAPTTAYHQVRPRESFAEPSECTTPFGTLLGIANNTPAFSNCRRGLKVQWASYFDFDNPMDVSEPLDFTTQQKFITTNRYLAMDFVMRWMAHNFGLMLMASRDVDKLTQNSYFFNPARPAQEWDAEFIANHRKGNTREKLVYIRPRAGDIILYNGLESNPNDLHLAVIVGVENDIERAGGTKRFKELLDHGITPRIIYIAEQNFDNKPWEGKNYSRIAYFRWVESPGEKAPKGFIEDSSGMSVLGRLRVGKPRPLHVEKDPYDDIREDL